jgi:UDP-N-acetylmuramate--alanine ligase
MTKPSSIHFVGIKGVGMTPLAIIAKEAGIVVTGSDIDEDFITDEPLRMAGITPLKGFSPEHVGDADLVITTGAHGGYDNVEVKLAKEQRIPVLTKGEAVGAYMDGAILGTAYKGISVAGSHGKTTTSAMIATILTVAGKDPGYLIGTSEVPTLSGKPGHFGQGQSFIAEADEYANEPTHDKSPQFWHQHPKIILVTNIEHDHPDIYPTLDDVRAAFLQFARQLPKDGLLVICGDGEQAKKFLTEYSGNVRTYGFSPLNDYCITDYRVSEGKILFRVQGKDVDLGDFSMRIPGEHNAVNALGAFLVATEVGISAETAKDALSAFIGTKRRLEYRGKLSSGAIVYDDYAHHPTEIKSSLKALRSLYPDSAIVCIFQPHTYSRTKTLFHEFAGAFTDTDTLILLPIYSSQRETADASISSVLLAESIKKLQKNVILLDSAANVVEYIDKNRFGNQTVLVTMGAGDVYKLLEGLTYSETNDDYTGTTRSS